MVQPMLMQPIMTQQFFMKLNAVTYHIKYGRCNLL